MDEPAPCNHRRHRSIALAVLVIVIVGAPLSEVRASPVPLESFRLEADEVEAIVALQPAWREVVEARIAQYNTACAEVIESHATCRRWFRSTGTETLSFIHLRASVELAEELQRLAEASVSELRKQERTLAEDLAAFSDDGQSRAQRQRRLLIVLRAFRLDDDGRLDPRIFSGRPEFFARVAQLMAHGEADDARSRAFTTRVRMCFDVIEAAPYDAAAQWQTEIAARRVEGFPAAESWPSLARTWARPTADAVMATIDLREFAIAWVGEYRRSGAPDSDGCDLEPGLIPLTDADLEALARSNRLTLNSDVIRAMASERCRIDMSDVRDALEVSCLQLLKGHPISTDVITPVVAEWAGERGRRIAQLRTQWMDEE